MASAGAVLEPPWSRGDYRSLAPQILPDAATAQFRKRLAALPLLPAKQRNRRLTHLKSAQHRRGSGRTEGTAPSDEIADRSSTICTRVAPRVRRVSSRTRLLKRASASVRCPFGLPARKAQPQELRSAVGDRASLPC